MSAGYIKDIPKDPMTSEANWEVVQEEVLLAVDQQDPGIGDVHSASNCDLQRRHGIQHVVSRPASASLLASISTLNTSALNK